MKIQDCVALVTGANRGIGAGFVAALLERGARRVYATARDPATLAAAVAADPSRVVALELDVTDATEVTGAAQRCRDLTLLVNNGGAAAMTSFLAPSLDGARLEMEVNFWGQLAMARAFAPVLAANGGGALLQVLSIGAMTVFPQVGTYCASKFAAHAMCKGLRAELAPQDTRVMAVFSGAIESDMSRNTPGPKIPALTHAHNCLAALEDGQEEYFPDFRSQRMRDAFRRDPEAFDRALRGRLGGG
ncbi:MAG: SDR family oxidoreductase [Steroidobacteraceae bacterium]|jgi:NAD(P)-dependent dehydrogenase (short-subunit alcohol dehydrogenase family)|nr:SDR family oxidoreductase [Steroidobacteraceae bacterium]